MSNFGLVAYAQISQIDNWSRSQARLDKVLKGSSNEFTVATGLMEKAVKNSMGIPANCCVDWTTGQCCDANGKMGEKKAIDWASILAFIETDLPELLSILAPFLSIL